MTYENYIMSLLVDFSAQDGFRYGGTDCTLAIAQVIANRVDAGWFGGDWLKVIRDAPSKRGTVYDPPFEVNTKDIAFRQTLTYIDDIYHGIADASGVNVDSEKGTVPSLYYCELNHLTELWFKKQILDDLKEHPRLAVVGQLTFFG